MAARYAQRLNLCRLHARCESRDARVVDDRAVVYAAGLSALLAATCDGDMQCVKARAVPRTGSGAALRARSVAKLLCSGQRQALGCDRFSVTCAAPAAWALQTAVCFQFMSPVRSWLACLLDCNTLSVSRTVDRASELDCISSLAGVIGFCYRIHSFNTPGLSSLRPSLT